MGTRSIAPAVERQPAVARVSNEQRVRHGSARPVAAIDVVGVLTRLVALVMHVPLCPSVRCLPWTAPKTGDTEQVGAVPRGTHQLSAQPGTGAIAPVKSVGADVGGDAKRNHGYAYQPTSLSGPGGRTAEPGARRHHGAASSARCGTGYFPAGS